MGKKMETGDKKPKTGCPKHERRIEELEREVATNMAGWKRALADYDNLKKDLIKEKDSIRRSSKEDCVQQIIPVLDNFEQAIQHEPEGKEVQSWSAGVRFIKQQLEDVLKDMGAERFGKVGDEFDPNQHEAMEETDQGEPNKIFKVQLSGWQIGDKIIRPAKVIVNKA